MASKLDRRLARFKLFQRDIAQRLSSRLGHRVEFTGDLPWFELGMMYSDLDLNGKNDEVAADMLADYIIEQGLV